MSKQQKKFQIDILQPHEVLPFFSFQGVTILELYARWCGPTPAVEQVFRQYYLQYSGAPIKFVRAPSDILPFARRYHGRCRPVFLILQGGVIVKAFCGIDLPQLDKYFQSEPAKLSQNQNELPEARPFLPDVQMKELLNDYQFLSCWAESFARRSEAQEKVELAKQNNVDVDIDPDEVFDSVVTQYQEKWSKLDNYDDVGLATGISIPDESDYASVHGKETEEEKLVEFMGNMQQMEQKVEEVAEAPETIISRMLPLFQQYYEQAPESINIASIFDECAKMNVDSQDQRTVEKMAALADSTNQGAISRLECCLIAAAVQFRPKLTEIRDGTAYFVEVSSAPLPEYQADGEQQEQQPAGGAEEHEDNEAFAQNKPLDEQQVDAAANSQEHAPPQEERPESAPHDLNDLIKASIMPGGEQEKSENQEQKAADYSYPEEQPKQEPHDPELRSEHSYHASAPNDDEARPKSQEKSDELQKEQNSMREQAPNEVEGGDSNRKSESKHDDAPEEPDPQADASQALENEDPQAGVPQTLEEPIVEDYAVPEEQAYPAATLKEQLGLYLEGAGAEVSAEPAESGKEGGSLKDALAASLKPQE